VVKFDDMQRFVASGPNVLRALAPRSYQGADGWCSPIVPATFFGMECGAAINAQGQPPPITQLLVTMAGKLCSQRVPTFHVGADMLDAVTRTVPPAGMSWATVKFPHTAGVFLLPRGSMRTGDGRSWDWVAWTLTKPGETVKIPGAWEYPTSIASDDGADMISLATASAFPDGRTDGMLVWNASLKQAGDLCRDWMDPRDTMGGVAPNDVETDALRNARIIVANLFLALEVRPELVERTGQRVRTIKKGPAREKWTPNWIGRTYRIQRADGDGTHASPRLHWRRGHYRRQPVGAGRKEHKVIWLEPCLVGAD
jgi:hypothetical protein